MLVREPRSTFATTICFVTWSTTMTAIATRSASRHARPAGPTRRSAAGDEVGDDASDKDQHDRAHHRAEVDRGRPKACHRQDPPKQVEVRVHDVAHERQDDVEWPAVGDARQ